MSEADTYHDDELEQFEREQERGEPWLWPKEPGEKMAEEMPNPLVTRAVVLREDVPLRGGDTVCFYHGRDKTGKLWSILIGPKTLYDSLVLGIEKDWREDTQEFVETGRVGPVQPGELVSVLYSGHREVASGPNRGRWYPAMKVKRLPAPNAAPEAPDDDIPF